jgi:hypothetical protein
MKKLQILAIALSLVAIITNGQDTSPSKIVAIGQIGVLISNDAPFVIVSASEKVYNDLWQAILADDTIGEAQMEMDGQIARVEPGTKAKVIGFGSGLTSKVRIMEGEQTGRAVWVSVDWIKPLSGGAQ